MPTASDYESSFQIPPRVVREIRKDAGRFSADVAALFKHAVEKSFILNTEKAIATASGRCGSCRWWGLQCHADRVDETTVRYCQSPMVIQPNYGERNNKKMRHDGVLTCDEGGCTGELMTGPGFGCVNYQARK